MSNNYHEAHDIMRPESAEDLEVSASAQQGLLPSPNEVQQEHFLSILEEDTAGYKIAALLRKAQTGTIVNSEAYMQQEFFQQKVTSIDPKMLDCNGVAWWQLKDPFLKELAEQHPGTPAGPSSHEAAASTTSTSQLGSQVSLLPQPPLGLPQATAQVIAQPPQATSPPSQGPSPPPVQGANPLPPQGATSLPAQCPSPPPTERPTPQFPQGPMVFTPTPAQWAAPQHPQPPQVEMFLPPPPPQGATPVPAHWAAPQFPQGAMGFPPPPPQAATPTPTQWAAPQSSQGEMAFPPLQGNMFFPPLQGNMFFPPPQGAPPQPPPAKTRPAKKAARRKVVCVPCHNEGWDKWCDGGKHDCENCALAGKSCHRPKCEDFKGCTDPACRKAHKNDGVPKFMLVDAGRLKRKLRDGEEPSKPPNVARREEMKRIESG